jgi:RES domain-containing protein
VDQRKHANTPSRLGSGAATALLETLVHIEIDSEDRPDRFQVLRIEGPDSLSIEKVKAGSLSPNWADDMSIAQTIGDRWLGEGRSLLLQVPSVLVPEICNVLVNPQQAESTRLRIIATYEHAFDVGGPGRDRACGVRAVGAPRGGRNECPDRTVLWH